MPHRENFISGSATYQELGCETLVVPYLDASHFDSEEHAVETARRAPTVDFGLTVPTRASNYHTVFPLD